MTLNVQQDTKQTRSFKEPYTICDLSCPSVEIYVADKCVAKFSRDVKATEVVYCLPGVVCKYASTVCSGLVKGTTLDSGQTRDVINIFLYLNGREWRGHCRKSDIKVGRCSCRGPARCLSIQVRTVLNGTSLNLTISGCAWLKGRRGGGGAAVSFAASCLTTFGDVSLARSGC